MLKLLELLEECRRGNHDLTRILDVGRSCESMVARWCKRCGNAVVDVDYDGRTNAGQIMKMRSSEFLRQAVAAIHRKLLCELLTMLRSDITRHIMDPDPGEGYMWLTLEAMAEGATPIKPEFAAKVRFLATVVQRLEGGYDNEGVNAWFERERVELGGRSPVQILTRNWDPASKEAQIILELARALSSSPAT